MLANFVAANRESIIARARARVASRTYPKPSDVELTNGIPVFLDQLGNALHLATESSEDVGAHDAIKKSGGRHGVDLFRMGLTVAQVVRDYGDVCQAITELAVEQRAPIPPEEFRTLNLCLDDAIAEAVSTYAEQREHAISDHGTERLGMLAHEVRNLLNTAMLSFELIKEGKVALGGSTALMLGRSLVGLRDLVDRSLADVRLDAGIEHRERIGVAEFVEEIEIGALIQAHARGLHFAVTSVDRSVTIEGDRQILAAAVLNLLQNAFKFTREDGNVSLTVSTTADRVLFDIEDECGGLPPGKAEDLFHAYEQRGHDRSGVGLGLAICLKAARANGGEIRVRDIPGKGCVFTLDMPKKSPPTLLVIDGGKSSAGSSGAVTADAKGAVGPKAGAC
jgi:signal transduction histidine kinase